MLSSKEKADIKQKMESNNHEIYVISFEQLKIIAKQKGPTAVSKECWKLLNKPSDLAANWTGTTKDSIILSKLIKELGFTGKVYIKTYGGKPHIILKGYSGLRSILTGTKYGLNNAKIVKMGLGASNVAKGAASGGIFTMVLLTGFRVVDYILNDETTLTRLIGSLATDVVKVGLATGASALAALAVGAVTTIAIGPLAAAIFVGTIASLGLTWLDDNYHFTDCVVKKLDEISNDINSYINQTKQDIYNGVIDGIHSAMIETEKYVYREIKSLVYRNISKHFPYGGNFW